ncbi:MAG: hypothetical protein JWQ01_1678 [Massilia sp.]|nr:hypothetical protein [Massilia sp.]
MQLLQTTHAGVAAGAATAPERASATVSTVVARSSTQPVAPLRQRGLSNWDTGLQREVAGAQQALDFLGQGASQLQGLKGDLSAALALRPLREGQLEARVRQFGDTWQQRAALSGGTLDGPAPAFDPANWRSGDTEGVRQTLQQVVKGLARFRQAQDVVRQTLAVAAERAEPAQPADAGIAMARLAGQFADSAGAPGYTALLGVHSALAGVSRERVTALLALRK